MAERAWVAVGKTLDEWLALPNALRVFRAYPGDPDWYLYKEGLPFRGVWAIHRRTDVEGAELFFAIGPLSKLEMLTQLFPIGLLSVASLAWDRRTWLRANAVRMPNTLWRQGRRLH